MHDVSKNGRKDTKNSAMKHFNNALIVPKHYTTVIIPIVLRYKETFPSISAQITKLFLKNALKTGNHFILDPTYKND